MAARQIIEVVQCRVADLKIGDVIRVAEAGWGRMVGVGVKPETGRLLVETTGAFYSLWPWDLVNLQLTRTAYSNAPHTVDVYLPEDGSPAVRAEFEVDEMDAVTACIYSSDIDGAVVIDIDTTFGPFGSGPGAPGDEGRDIRITLNDGTIWNCGLWNPKHEQRVPDSA